MNVKDFVLVTMIQRHISYQQPTEFHNTHTVQAGTTGPHIQCIGIARHTIVSTYHYTYCSKLN